MSKKYSVRIIGDGRIGRAVRWYLEREPAVAQVGFLTRERQAASCDLLIGALAGELGERCLKLALEYRTNLIDISDVDPPFYLRHRRRIQRCGITVIPGCGFSPGIVNGILGRELDRRRAVGAVEVKAGSLSPLRSHYPFLWCFEDIVLEHMLSSWQIVAGKKRKYPAFAGYQSERYGGIDAESYYVASGFENILEKVRPRTFVVRVVRPAGFREFFAFLKGYGLLEKENILRTKELLEARRADNITLADISIAAGTRRIRWKLQAQSKADEELNSMQKITASVPAVMARMLSGGMIAGPGLLFMEDIGRDARLFDTLVRGVREKGIAIAHA